MCNAVSYLISYHKARSSSVTFILAAHVIPCIIQKTRKNGAARKNAQIKASSGPHNNILGCQKYSPLFPHSSCHPCPGTLVEWSSLEALAATYIGARVPDDGLPSQYAPEPCRAAVVPWCPCSLPVAGGRQSGIERACASHQLTFVLHPEVQEVSWASRPHLSAREKESTIAFCVCATHLIWCARRKLMGK